MITAAVRKEKAAKKKRELEKSVLQAAVEWYKFQGERQSTALYIAIMNYRGDKPCVDY